MKFWAVYSYQLPEAEDGKLFFEFFFDQIILNGQEGRTKYSSNEILKRALGKNHPIAHCPFVYANCQEAPV